MTGGLRASHRRLAPALLALALLAGCATPPPAPGELPWTHGRLALIMAADADRPAQNVNLAFELRGDGDAGELRLNSPFGSRVAMARWAPGLALLQTSDGEQRFATLDELSRQALGEALPLAALPDWLAGRAWAGAPHASQTAGFEQLGWQVLLARHAEGLVEARRLAPPAVVVRVRLDERAAP